MLPQSLPYEGVVQEHESQVQDHVLEHKTSGKSRHRLQHLKTVADDFLTDCEVYFTDIARLFGESTYDFKTLEELERFLKVPNTLETLGKETVEKLQKAVSEYVVWKTTTEFNEMVVPSHIRTRLALQNTLPQGEVTHLTDLVSVSEGLENTRHIVKTEAHGLLEALGEDKEIEARKRRLALSLLKFALNVVNAGVAVDVVHEVLTHTVDEGRVLLAVLGAETLKEFSYMTDEQLTKLLEEHLGKQLSDQYIDKTLDILWSLSIKFLDKNIKYSEAIDKPLTDDELISLIEAVRVQHLLPALKKAHYPQGFHYSEFVAETIATQIKEKNQSMLKALKDSLTEVEKEAKTVTTLDGESHRVSLKHSMLRLFNDGNLTRNYFKAQPKFIYSEAKTSVGIPGYKLMHRDCDNTSQYFPVTMDPEVMPLLQPKPPKSKIQLTHKMHIGGRHARHHMYSTLPDLKDPIFGFKKGGKYKQKDRIRDTWRADHIVQIVLGKSINVTGNPHVFLPFPTFKSVQEMGDAVISILKINPNFRSGNYKYKQGKPHPTPLYLISHMEDYKWLIDRPGVKEYILSKIDTSLILQSLTDLNIRDAEDKPRMKQVLEDTFLFLEKIGYDKNNLIYIRGLCEGYITQQCANPSRIARMEKLTQELGSLCSGPYDYSNFISSALKQKHAEINALIKVCEELRQNQDNNDRIKVIEDMIVSYLTHNRHEFQTTIALEKLLPKLLSGEKFTSDEEKVVKAVKKNKATKGISRDTYYKVKEYIEVQKDVDQLKTFQASFLASQVNAHVLVPQVKAPVVALTHADSKSSANDGTFKIQHNKLSHS